MAAYVAAQVPNAPPRPNCRSLSGPGSCDWKTANGVGPGVRVVLSDRTGGHEQSKTYLREALTRLSEKYGFTLTRIASLNDITEAYLRNAKVIIFSNGDGDSGGSIPNATVRARVEDFVKQKGWGMIMIHAACSFVSSWSFNRQACVQGYNHHNNSGTSATLYAENRIVDGVGHGRANPHTSFFLAGLPDSVRMSDEWFTWSAAPRTTTHVDSVPIANLNMLLRMNEASLPSPAAPTYGIDHDLMWTHTQGKGITIYQSFGHDNVYLQDGTDHGFGDSLRLAYGDSLLWREIRYAAKDWDTVSSVTSVASRIHSRFGLSDNSGSISLSFGDAPRVSVRVIDITGRQIYSRTFAGERSAEIRGLQRGVYWVRIASGSQSESHKVSLY
jgi:hypothetical protein